MAVPAACPVARSTACSIALLLSLSSPAFAAAQPEEGLLGGPSVQTAEDRATLVERDYEGNLRRLERRAEYLAVDLLGLTDTQRAAADEVIEARAALAEQIVFDNLPLLTELQAASAGGDASAGWLGGNRDLRRRVMEVVRPLMQQEPMADRIAEALPSEARDEYRRIVDEYAEAQREHQAQRQAQRPTQQPAGEDGQRRERPARNARGGERMAEFGQRLRAVGQEIKDAYDRGASARQDDLDSFLADLELRPEQEGEIREIIRRNFEAGGGGDTRAQRSKTVREILPLLDADQRRRLMERLRG